MKKLVLLFAIMVMAFSLWSNTNILWNCSDAPYLLPQENFFAFPGIDADSVCYFDFYAYLNGAMVTSSLLSGDGTQDILNELGYFQYWNGNRNFGGNWVSDSSTPIQLRLPIASIYVDGYDFYNIPSPGDIMTAEFDIGLICNVQYYDNTGFWATLTCSKFVQVKFHNRRKGDVDDDSVSTVADLQTMMYLYQHGWSEYQLHGYNMAACNVKVPWISPLNFYLYNLWLNDHNNLMVADLGIGEYFPLNNPGYQVINPVIVDQIITIPNTENCNLYSVLGIHADGTQWTESIILEGEQKSCWRANSTSIEPVIEPNNRTDEVQFVMPNDVTFIRAIATTLNTATLNNDPVVTIVNPVLNNASPNPFTCQTSISYSMPKAGNVEVAIYNIKGQLVRTLVNETKSGSNSVTWNGTDQNGHAVSAGVYFYKMKSGNYSETKKMILMK